MGLGLVVAFLQAFVFALLTMIYIGLALEDRTSGGLRVGTTHQRSDSSHAQVPSTVLWTVLFVIAPLAAMAEEGRPSGGSSWGYALGAGLAVGLAGLGCGIGQGLTAATPPRASRATRRRGRDVRELHPRDGADRVDRDLRLVIAFMLQGKI
jgi:hypothetical protein